MTTETAPNRETIEAWRRLPLPELMHQALAAKLAHRGRRFSLCSIINAKSGRCSEDCAFCVQSAHFRTDAPVYPFKDKAEIVAAARKAREIGADRFSIVTSGRGMNAEEVAVVADTVRAIRDEVGIKVCVSLGILARPELETLRDAGASRYHHNLETSERFFPAICSTHSFRDKIETIARAREAGLSVCSGGIFGMGEGWEDRTDLAFRLRDLGVDSVPINFLMPIEGTRLGNRPLLEPAEALRIIAIYRLILPDREIRVCGGRSTVLGERVDDIFRAGADGFLMGNYLTTLGRDPAADRAALEERDLAPRA